jgi:hypothetical protein
MLKELEQKIVNIKSNGHFTKKMSSGPVAIVDMLWRRVARAKLSSMPLAIAP